MLIYENTKNRNNNNGNNKKKIILYSLVGFLSVLLLVLFFLIFNNKKEEKNAKNDKPKNESITQKATKISKLTQKVDSLNKLLEPLLAKGKDATKEEKDQIISIKESLVEMYSITEDHIGDLSNESKGDVEKETMINLLKTQLQTAQRDVKNLESKIKEYEEKVTGLITENSDLKGTIRVKDKVITEIDKDKRNAEEKVKIKEDENEKLKNLSAKREAYLKNIKEYLNEYNLQMVEVTKSTKNSKQCPCLQKAYKAISGAVRIYNDAEEDVRSVYSAENRVSLQAKQKNVIEKAQYYLTSEKEYKKCFSEGY